MNRGRGPLAGWLTAEAVSITGTRVSMIALPLLVFTTTGSAAQTGLVALVEMLPLVVAKVLSGPVIDRVGARRVAITCDVGSLVAVAAIPLLHEVGHLPLPGLLALVALVGALRGPSDAAKYALVPVLVERSGAPTERVTGLHGTVERTASMAGAGLAGALVAAVGPANALLVDAVSFGVAASVLAWTTRDLPAPSADEESDVPYRRQLAEGWDFLRRDRVLVAITLMVGVTNLLDTAYATVLMPVWAVQSGHGAGVLGLVFATFSAAAALGAASASAWAARMPRRLVYLVAFTLARAPKFVVVALDAPVAAVLAVSVVGGFAAGFINPILGAVTFERIPEHLTGRVTAISVASSWALMPLGGVVGGLLVGSWGLAAAFVVLGVAYVVTTTLPAVDPAWRQIERSPDRSSDRSDLVGRTGG